MSATQSQQYIGKRGQWRAGGKALVFDVEVVDARESYGRTDLRIKPASGTGEAWVSSESVKLPS